MCERSKYAINGVYKCENFQQFLALRSFPEHPIGSAGYIDGWHIKWNLENDDGLNCAYVMISCSDKPTLKLRYLINIRKKNGRLFFKREQRLVIKNCDGLKGCSVATQLLLHEDMGSLVNGAIIVEYGLQVEAVLGSDGIWNFNLDNELFGWMEKQNMVTCKYQNCITGRKTIFYCHKQLLIFHSSNYIGTIHKVWVNHGSSYLLDKCFQIAHGVQVQLKDDEYIDIIIMAQDSNLLNEINPMLPCVGIRARLNVIHYCEQHFLRLHHSSSKNFLWDAIMFNLRHVLAHSLKEIESLEDLVSEVKEMEIDEMPGESMKMIAAKIFETTF